MLIERPPRLFRCLVPGGIFRMPPGPEGRDIYLTFDDGLVPQATPWVLDTLDRFDIKATFFMVGDNARRYPGLVDEVRRRGHRLGNHTMHHLQGEKVTSRTYLRDVAEAQTYIGTAPGQEIPLFRPPHGWLRPRQARALRRHYRLVMYDLVSRDYSRRLAAPQVVDIVKRYARPGAIVVFHDSVKSMPRTREALPAVLEWLLQEGYIFKTI